MRAGRTNIDAQIGWQAVPYLVDCQRRMAGNGSWCLANGSSWVNGQQVQSTPGDGGVPCKCSAGHLGGACLEPAAEPQAGSPSSATATRGRRGSAARSPEEKAAALQAFKEKQAKEKAEAEAKKAEEEAQKLKKREEARAFQEKQKAQKAARSSGGAAGGSGGSAEDEMKAFLDERGLSEYHELFLSRKGGDCKRLSQITMKMNTKRRIRAASRKVPAFKAMTDEQCEQVAAAVMKK